MPKHFSDKELACRHCGVNETKPALHALLERIRAVYGKPIRINSAYRCSEHNLKIGGSPNSQHVTGLAADLMPINGGSLKELFEAARACDPKGLGLYIDENFVHVDVRAEKRLASWAKVGGKIVSLTEGLKHLK
jgi:uncharacterized protein YcbK (DUF882 family)